MRGNASDELARELRAFCDRFGAAALDERRRVVALLSDRMTDAGRDLRILGIVIDNGAVAALRAAGAAAAPMEMDRLAARVESHVGLPQTLTLPVLRALAFALGVGGTPSGYVDTDTTASSPARAPVPPPAAPRQVPPTAIAHGRPAVSASRPGGFPFGLLPIALYFVGMEGLALHGLIQGGAGAVISLGEIIAAGDYITISQQAGFGGLGLLLCSALATGLGVVVAAAMRRRIFRRLMALWLGHGLLAVLYFLLGEIYGYPPGWPPGLFGTVLMPAVALISGIGMAYTLKSERVRTTFNR